MKLPEWWPKKLFGTIAWILVLGFLAYRMAPQVMAAAGIGAAGPESPTFTVTTLDGEIVALDAYRGQVVLVNFWATWCPPCRLEMPGFQRVYEDRRADGFVVIGLSTDRAGTSVVREFTEERDITFPIAMATGRIVQDFGGVRSLPTSFLIDREGRVRHEVRGYFAEPALRLAVRQLLDEPVSTPPSREVVR